MPCVLGTIRGTNVTIPVNIDENGAVYVVLDGGAWLYIEDTPFQPGARGPMLLGVRNDVGGSLVDADGDWAPLQLNANGELVVTGALSAIAESTTPMGVPDGAPVRVWHDTVGRQVIQVGAAERRFVANEYVVNQAFTEQIPAPGPNSQIMIYDVLVSTGTAGTALFLDGSGARLFGRMSFAANGGWCFNSAKGFAVTAGRSVTLTTTTGVGPLAVTINYAILPSL